MIYQSRASMLSIGIGLQNVDCRHRCKQGKRVRGHLMYPLTIFVKSTTFVKAITIESLYGYGYLWLFIKKTPVT